MNPIPLPRKAEKKRVKLKMAVQGPSGSGKTWGALALAKNLWPEAKVCLIDTENESASLYADHFEFDTIPLGPPFETARYVACIDAVVKGGYDVLIIDSITPQWDGVGGILRRKEAKEKSNPAMNSYALWAEFTPEHEAFKQVILQSPLHTICTMRSKQEFALQQNEKGKLVPIKLGLAPIQRDQIDYEFTIVFDVSMTHVATASKDRTDLFNDKQVNLADPATAEAVRNWLAKGVDIPVTGDKKDEPIPFPAKAEPFEFTPPSTLHCVIKGVSDLKGDANRQRVEVTFNGLHNTCNFATCFDLVLFDLLRESIGKEVHLTIKEADKNNRHFVNIQEVSFVDGVPHAAGKPVTGENQDAEPTEAA